MSQYGLACHVSLNKYEYRHKGNGVIISDVKKRVAAIAILMSFSALGVQTVVFGQTAVRKDTDRLLLQSAARGDAASVQKALDQGANIEAKDVNGETALMIAAGNGDAKVARVLLQHGANIHTTDLDLQTALVNAAMEGNPAMVELLCEHKPTKTELNEALLASAGGGPLVLDVKNGEYVEHSISEAKASYVAVVRALLRQGANIETKRDDGATPLMVAASHGAINVTKFLLDRGALVDARDKEGNTALMLAACDCAIIDMPDTADTIRLLLNRGANIEATDKDGGTALMAAAGWGRTHIIRLLLQNGARADAKDNKGNTALDWARKGKQSAAVRMLTESRPK